MFILIGILIFPLVSSICEQGQINVNTASTEELKKIINIGPSYSEQIIQLRPFESIEGLTRVSGIAETRLNEIKNEGLACVGEDISQEKNSSEKENETNSTNSSNIIKENSNEEDEENQNKDSSNSPVKLNLNQDSTKEETDSKDIKKLSNNNINKDKIAKYGLAGFCMFLIIIYLTNNKKTYKNEFR